MKCAYCGEPLTNEATICPNCGRPRLRSIAARQVALSDLSGRQFELRPGISRLGRDPSSNEVVLMDSSVSARHAAIEVSQNAIVLRDLGSTNGTTVNSMPIRQAVQIDVGDRVAFGDRVFTVVQQEATHPRAPRGIPVPISSSKPRRAAPATAPHVPAALATIALILLAVMLQSVGLVDSVQRDDTLLPAPLLVAGLVVLPLIAIAMIAVNRRSGYLVAAVSAALGLLFIVISGPMFAGSSLRDTLEVEYGTNGYWFIAIAAVFAMVMNVLLLTVAIAGWRGLQPEQEQTTSATQPTA